MLITLAVALAPLALASAPYRPQDEEPRQDAETELTPLLGLWGVEAPFGPEVRGSLQVERQDDRWVASLSGYTVQAIANEGWLEFQLPDDLGSFRGKFEAGALVGHWTQPPGRVNESAYATPTVLDAVDEATWRGEVVPLDEQLSLYVEFKKGTDGTILALLRNPERNLGIFHDLGRVERRGRELLLHDRAGEQVSLRGRLAEDLQSWSLEFPGWDVPFEMTRRGRDQAPGYYPRPLDESRYEYRVPSGTEDGWPTAHAKSVGFDVSKLEQLVQRVLDTEYKARSTPYIQGILIARRGQLVLDEYFYGFDAGRPHDTRSSAKSLTALLVGIAIDGDAGFETTTPVLEVFSNSDSIARVDERKRALTVEHLLTMNSGFDCDDDDESTPGNEGTMQSQSAQPDWIRYALDLPMVRDPGARAVYCTAGIHLLGGVIERSTGVTLPEFLREVYALPLEIQRYHLNLSPTGRAYMGGGIQFLPRDHLKLGQLLVSGGRWKDKQIVSEDWIYMASAPHSSIHAQDDYGYGLWRTELSSNDLTFDVVYASGNGGQLVIAIPELELVVQFTGGNYQNYPTWSRFLHELVPAYVLASVQD